MIELKNLTKVYTSSTGKSVVGLNQINLTLPNNGFVSIIGESGSGKSTLLNVVSLIDSYDDGELIIDGISTETLTEDEIEIFRRENIGFVFQNFNLIDSYTVLENVMLPIIIRGVSKEEAKQEALSYLELVGIKKRYKHKAIKLSGGEKQRCVIARALASKNRILACDEPTGNLDAKSSKEIVNILKELSKDHLILMVTHDLPSVKNCSTQIISVKDGKIVNNDVIKEYEQIDTLTRHVDDVPKKVTFSIALKNLIRTPKKTLLSISMIVLWLTFFSILLYTVFVNRGSLLYNKVYLYDDTYNVSTNKRNLLNNKTRDLSEIDESSLKGDIIYNDQYLDVFLRLVLKKTNDVEYAESFQVNLNIDKSKNYTPMAGVKPTNSHELFIVLDKTFYKSETASIIGTVTDIEGETFTITGATIDKSLSSSLFEVSDVDDELIKLLLYSYIYDHAYSSFLITNNYNVYLDSLNSLEDAFYPNDYVIYMPLRYKNSNFKMYSGYKEIDLSKYELNYNYDLFYYSFATMLDIIEDNPGRASIIYSNTSASTKEFELLSKDYEIINLSKLYVYKTDKSNVSLYFGACISFIAIGILLIFVTRYLIDLLYKNHKKDYGIIRMMGLLKDDVKKLSKYEIIMGTIFSVLTYFVILLLLLALPFSRVFIFNIIKSIYVPIVSVAVTIIFGLYLSFYISSNALNLNITKSLKAGGFND